MGRGLTEEEIESLFRSKFRENLNLGNSAHQYELSGFRDGFSGNKRSGDRQGVAYFIYEGGYMGGEEARKDYDNERINAD